METNEIRRTFKDILEDYAYNPDIMSPVSERVERLQEIIFRRLSKCDRNIILLYIDHPSYRDLGKRLGISHTSAGEQVKRVKGIIIREFQRRSSL